ncbi:mannose-1-phosphate guanyltransferase [Methyloceanibacter stevinii]|uniref:mannose-1-phosphate guanylyltransferase n=1 Tax=Methyloceanibacter stevinii TaxID=1774970 RepID=A0A1E3VSD8_9HYPH|nr:mannose-1-phosphate guanylyltransferase/mannose-6-phosphate isomerase [Methyloceanibacter stevinii]ODR95866.1 mannose-1-phosphate guanyltransferase [Methyloceanibacter stevinii]
MGSHCIPVIMCGGAGTRVWPESRETLPKQFITLVGDQSTFQRIISMISDPAVFDQPVVITNRDYRFFVAEQLAELGVAATIVLEPERRDSGPAVAAAAELAAKAGPDTVVAMFAADHIYEKPAEFIGNCKAAIQTAVKGNIVSFGIKPTHPATNFGYIRPGAPIEGTAARKIEAFVEKPDAETAERYIAEGYLWNSGNFVFPAEMMRAEIERFEPEMAVAVAEAVATAETDLDFLVLGEKSFGRATKKSIDYAVMERTDRSAVLEADMGWNDLGTWSSALSFTEADAAGNSVRGDGIVLNCTNVHVRSPEMLTAVVGLDDVVVVTTADAVLVLNSKEADKVKLLVDDLRKRGRRELVEHKRVYRPWGYYQGVDQGARHQVKRILVKPGASLSLQKHFHRAEHWIVVKGTAEVTRDNEVILVHENESIYLPIGCTHRLANPGKIELELIEVQTGSYLGEDDIIRFEDIYNRT